MAVIVKVNSRERPLDVTDYRVSESATPLVPGSGNASIGQLSLSARAIIDGPLKNRTAAIVEGTVRLIDTEEALGSFRGRGEFLAKISEVSEDSNEEFNLSAEGILSNLNQEVEAEAHYGIQPNGKLASVGSAFEYYCGLADVTLDRIQVAPELFDIPVVYRRWADNLWTKLQDFCSANNVQIVVAYDRIVLQSPRTHDLLIENYSDLSRSSSVVSSSLAVEIVNQNTRIIEDGVVYISESTYTVNSGGLTSFVAQVEGDLYAVTNPEAVSRYIPREALQPNSTGTYIVSDKDNNTVDPTWWEEHNGRVTVQLDNTEGKSEITVLIQGADATDTYEGPFTIGAIINGNDLDPALVITGSGIFDDPKTVVLATGATETYAQNAAPTIDNLFITTRELANERGILAAQAACGPTVTIRGGFAFDPNAAGQEFGVIVGGRVKVKNNVFRVMDVSIEKNSVTFTAIADMLFSDLYDLYNTTFNDFNKKYANNTFNDFNTLFSGKTFDQFDSMNDQPKFADFDKMYEGVNFNDYSVSPYIKLEV